MILSVCNDPELLEIVMHAKTVIKVLQIVVPFGLILYASIDIIKAVISQDNGAISKKLSMIPKRVLAAAIVFFVPSVLDFVMGIANDQFDYNSCFENANEEFIEERYKDLADQYVTDVESSLTYVDYNDAILFVNRIKDASLKKSYQDRLKDVREKIDAAEKERHDAANAEGNGNSASGNTGGSSGGSSGGNSSLGQDIVNYAKKYTGIPYVYGTSNLNKSVDCSGFTMQVFKNFNISLTHSANSQASAGKTIGSLSDAKAGDLLFYDWDGDGHYDHVAIYMGNNKRIHASGNKSCPSGGLCKVVIDSSAMNSVKKIKRVW